MKLKQNKIIDEISISVDGTESWLSGIYQEFQIEKSSETQTLIGKMKLALINGDTETSATGEFVFQTQISCQRCAEPIPKKLDVQFDVIFGETPSRIKDSKQCDLQAEDLDRYYYNDQGDLDLEELLNDQIHLAIPTSISCHSIFGHHCFELAEPDESGMVYQDPKDEDENPFAKLKGLLKN